MSVNFVKIIEVAPCILPTNSILKRQSPRSDSCKSSDYNEKFDFYTLAFDVFMSDDKLVFSGPPSYGLENLYNKKNFILDGRCTQSDLHITMLDRTQRNWFYSDSKIKLFQWGGTGLEFNIVVNENFHHVFKNKKVLFTLSKNNKLEWISDWIKFYKKIHLIDAVLFYDNNSDYYSVEELKEYLIKEKLEVDIIIVPWNFKYGPQGGTSAEVKNAPWDSDFCQYGMMEHAKERFLKYASGVINVDVDELILNENKKSVFEELEKVPGVQISGRWIESIPLYKTDLRRFNNFFYYDKSQWESDYKWCINPQKIENDVQWKVHTVKSKKLQLSKNFYYAHYKGINYNWKLNRADFIEFDPKKHRLDECLYDVIKRVFEVKDLPQLNLDLSFWEKLIKLNKVMK